MPWSVYILKCSDNSFYVGHSSDLKKRIETHNTGKGSRFTSLRLPVRLVYDENYSTREEAIKRETQLKKWSRAKKQALIDGDIEHLKKLSKSH